MFSRGVAFCFIFLVVLCMSSALFAQSVKKNDILRLEKRIERLERGVRAWYSRAPARQEQPLLTQQEESRKVSRAFSERLDALENDLRVLRSDIEKITFRFGKAEKRWDSLLVEVMERIDLMEKKLRFPIDNTPLDDGGEPMEEESQKPIPLPHSEKDKTLSPEEHYTHALDLLKKSRYGQAEKALNDFMTNYPEHELSHNALYWLGEIYYLRKNYRQSAQTFFHVYERSPKGNKSSAALLKLGLSFSHLEKKEEACATFRKLLKEFPQTDPSFIKKAREQINTAC